MRIIMDLEYFTVDGYKNNIKQTFSYVEKH